MMRGGLDGKQGAEALFVDRQGCVLSSTDPTRPVGTVLKLDASSLLDTEVEKSVRLWVCLKNRQF
jgi:hypothetical protein